MGAHTNKEYLLISGNSFKVQVIKNKEKIRDRIRDRAMQITKKIKGQAYAKNFNVPYKKTKCIFKYFRPLGPFQGILCFRDSVLDVIVL